MSLFCLGGSNVSFTLLEVFDKEDVLIVWGRLQVHKEHGERELGTKLLNIPNIGDRVAEYLNFRFNVGRIDEFRYSHDRLCKDVGCPSLPLGGAIGIFPSLDVGP
jgi:hypothetical protein